MALQASGAISLANIQTEFGGSVPISMNEYYAGGGYVAPGTGSIASSGAITINSFHATSSQAPAGSQTFTTSGTFTVPAGHYTVDVRMIGGGGNGGPDAAYSANQVNNTYYSYGGKSGQYISQTMAVTPGQNLTVTVGTAAQNTVFNGVTASAGASNTHSGNNGSSVSPYNSATYYDGTMYHWTYDQSWGDGGCCCTMYSTDNRYNYGGQASAFGSAGDASGGQGKNGNIGAGGAAGNGVGGRGECTISWGLGTPVQEVFTTNSTFTVPAGITSVRIQMIGGGGNGGGTLTGVNDSVTNHFYSYGGTAGQYIEKTVSVTSGASITVNVGGAAQSTSFGAEIANGGANNSYSGDNSVYLSPFTHNDYYDGTQYVQAVADVGADSGCCCDSNVDDYLHYYGGQAGAFGHGGDAAGGQGKNGNIGAGGAAGGGAGGRGECIVTWYV